MKAFVAKLVVKPKNRGEFERLQTELRTLSLEKEPGTLVYEFLRSNDDPNTYLVVATFSDDEAFQVHQQSSFHDEYVPAIFDCLAVDMEIDFYDALA